MQKINIDKKTVVFLALAIVLFGELFVVFPWEMKRISGLTKRIAKVTQRVNSIERKWPRKDKYLEGKELLKKEIKETRGRFFSPEQESKILSFISTGSKNFGVEIQSLLPGQLQDYTSTKVGEFKYLPIVVKANSGFHNLAMFLNYLSSSQYFFEVKELNILSGSPCNSIEMTICGVIEVK